VRGGDVKACPSAGGVPWRGWKAKRASAAGGAKPPTRENGLSLGCKPVELADGPRPGSNGKTGRGR